jgi:hypothetical protein
MESRPNNPAAKLDEARECSVKRRLDDLLDEGIASDPPIEFTPEWWRSRKEQLLATLPGEQSEVAR